MQSNGATTCPPGLVEITTNKSGQLVAGDVVLGDGFKGCAGALVCMSAQDEEIIAVFAMPERPGLLSVVRFGKEQWARGRLFVDRVLERAEECGPLWRQRWMLRCVVIGVNYHRPHPNAPRETLRSFRIDVEPAGAVDDEQIVAALAGDHARARDAIARARETGNGIVAAPPPAPIARRAPEKPAPPPVPSPRIRTGKRRPGLA